MKLEQQGARLGQLVLEHPKKIVALSLICASLASVGLKDAAFSADYKIFFSSADPQLASFQKLEAVFTKTDNVVFVVKARSNDVFETGPLTAIQSLTKDAWKLPYATRVDSLTNFQRAYAAEGDLVVEDLVTPPARKLSSAQLLQLKKAAFEEVLLVGALLSKDGATGGVNVTLRLPVDNPRAVTEVTKAARALAQKYASAHPEVEVKVSGMALMNDAFMEASIEDMSLIIPLMYAVMIIAMTLLLRSWLATFSVVLIVLLSSAVSLGVAGWLDYPLTPPSASAPTIVLTLAVADGVHIFVSMREAMRDGLHKRQAIVRALSLNLRPVFLTSLTTMIGFLCLNFAEAPPYWHLANMTSAGIVAALVFSLTLLPALLALGPVSAPKRSGGGASTWSIKLADFVIARRRPLLMLGLVVTIVFSAMAARLQTNDRFFDYFDDSISFRPDARFMMDNLTGLYSLEYQLGSEKGVAEPEYQFHLDRFTLWLRSQPEVRHVYSLSDILKRLNQCMHDERRYVVPTSRELAAQYLLLYEMSLPFGLALNDRVDIDKASSRVSVTVEDLSSRQMRAFKLRTERWLEEHTPKYMWTEATSPVVIFSYLSDRNTEAMMKGNFVSLILISLCLLFALKSVRLGLLSVLPNVLPIVLGYGLWSLIFGEINIVASVAGTVCLGIIVDDTIHFLSKYQLAREHDGMSSAQAIRHTLSHVGPALVVTTVVLLLGFGVLTLSGFQMNSYLGLLTVMVVSFALAADLLILPPLLMFVERGFQGGTK